MAISGAKVEITVLIGLAAVRIRDLLRMGRGAVINLNALQNDEVWILAAGKPIGRGEIVIRGEHIEVVVTKMLDNYGAAIAVGDDTHQI